MRNFRELDVWKEAIEVSTVIYKLGYSFPEYEKYGLTKQLQRSSVSIASNIAEGCSRASSKDFARFLEIAIGSAFELETQLEIALKLGYTENDESTLILNKLSILQKRLNSLRTAILK